MAKIIVEVKYASSDTVDKWTFPTIGEVTITVPEIDETKQAIVASRVVAFVGREFSGLLTASDLGTEIVSKLAEKFGINAEAHVVHDLDSRDPDYVPSEDEIVKDEPEKVVTH